MKIAIPNISNKTVPADSGYYANNSTNNSPSSPSKNSLIFMVDSNASLHSWDLEEEEDYDSVGGFSGADGGSRSLLNIEVLT